MNNSVAYNLDIDNRLKNQAALIARLQKQSKMFTRFLLQSFHEGDKAEKVKVFSVVEYQNFLSQCLDKIAIDKLDVELNKNKEPKFSEIKKIRSDPIPCFSN